MKSVVIVLCLTLSLQWGILNPVAFAINPVQPPDSVASADLSTPQKTVEAFFAALNRKDARTMVPCVLGATLSEDIDLLKKEFMDMDVPAVALSNVKVYKDEAGTESLVSFDLDTQSAGKSTGKSSNVLVVRKTGEAWKIVAPSLESVRDTNAMQDPGIANGLAMMIRYPELILEERSKAKTISSLSRVKQISTGLIMYVQDYDEVFVPNAARYKEVIAPYVRNMELFTSPLDSPGTISYRLNPLLAGKTLAKVREPANTVMIFEGEYKKLLFRYDGKAVIGFADGHAKMVTPEEAKKLRWTP